MSLSPAFKNGGNLLYSNRFSHTMSTIYFTSSTSSSAFFSFSALLIGKYETISLAMSIQLCCIAAEDYIAVKISSSSSSSSSSSPSYSSSSIFSLFTGKKTIALADNYNSAALLRKTAL